MMMLWACSENEPSASSSDGGSTMAAPNCSSSFGTVSGAAVIPGSPVGSPNDAPVDGAMIELMVSLSDCFG